MTKTKLETWVENLLAEIYKVTGRRNQSVEAKVDKSFIEYLALNAGSWPSLLVGWDDLHNGKTIQWAVIGTEFGCLKFIEGGQSEIPTKGVQEVEKETKQNCKTESKAEPPEIDDWYEQIGAMNT